jgi:cytochrome P450
LSHQKEGVAEHSFLSLNIGEFESKGGLDEQTTHELKKVAAQLFIAGVDTMSATLTVLFQQLVFHPEVLKKAQKEIDDVVGSDRLPRFEDREELPYLDYLLTEALRFYPVVPPGLPHLSTEDDVYEGMFIPKGSLVLANARYV